MHATSADKAATVEGETKARVLDLAVIVLAGPKNRARPALSRSTELSAIRQHMV